MTIWAFGDSYANHYKQYPDTWLNILANKLNTKIKGYGKPFSTANYCIRKFNQVRDQIKEEDVIILSFSALNPKEYGSYSFGDLHLNIETFSHNKRMAHDYHQEYLTYLEETKETYIINFLYNLNYLSKKLNTHTILLVTYDDLDDIVRPMKEELPYLHLPEGTLHKVSRYEWTEEIITTKDLRWIVSHDVRVNHLLKTNHTVLAKKLLDNIVHKTQINLTTDFKEHVFDEYSVNDLTFIEEELFPSYVRGYKIERKMKNYVINAVNRNIIKKDHLIRDLLNYMSDTEIKIFLNAYYRKFYTDLIEKI